MQIAFLSITEPLSLLTVHRALPLAGAIKKDTHAQGLGALGGDQPHLPADVIAALETSGLGFIPSGVKLQPGDALLDGAAKTGTDLKALFEAGIGIAHGADLVSLVMAGRSEERFFPEPLKFFRPAPIVANSPRARQITRLRRKRSSSVTWCAKTVHSS
jgi:hypothetical protein